MKKPTKKQLDYINFLCDNLGIERIIPENINDASKVISELMVEWEEFRDELTSSSVEIY